MAGTMPSTGNLHFRNYPLTGHIADMAQTTRLTHCGLLYVADADSADPEKRKDRSDKKQRELRGRSGPARGWCCRVADYAWAGSASQIFILRVSGIRNRPSTKHIAGTAIG
jgi:hypothetical protein